MCVLDGNAYDTKVVEAGEEREGDLEACALLLNNKAQALLAAGPGARRAAHLLRGHGFEEPLFITLAAEGGAPAAAAEAAQLVPCSPAPCRTRPPPDAQAPPTTPPPRFRCR